MSFYYYLKQVNAGLIPGKIDLLKVNNRDIRPVYQNIFKVSYNDIRKKPLTSFKCLYYSLLTTYFYCCLSNLLKYW